MNKLVQIIIEIVIAGTLFDASANDEIYLQDSTIIKGNSYQFEDPVS